MNVEDQNKLNALIQLLDDPNESIFEHVKSELLNYGEEAIPQLENYWEFNTYEQIFQDRIEDIIHQIQFDSIKTGLKEFIANPTSLLEGLFWLNKYQYPGLTLDELNEEIIILTQKVWLEINANMSPVEMVGTINQVFFSHIGFQPNKTHFHSPQNSFISDVLTSKKGNPLSLSAVYLLIARKLDLPICGVNLPNHFILGFQSRDVLQPKILFYINPFSRGSILKKPDLDTFLRQIKVKSEPSFYEPCSNVAMVKRTLTNLIYAFHKLGYTEKVQELEELAQLFNE